MQSEEFFKEAETMSKLRHQNIVWCTWVEPDANRSRLAATRVGEPERNYSGPNGELMRNW